MTADNLTVFIIGGLLGTIITKLYSVSSTQKEHAIIQEQRHRELLIDMSSIKAALGNILMLTTQTHRAMQETLQASENFVDALRESNDMGRPLDKKDDFRDLRKKFEDGIDGFDSKDKDDEDESDEEGPEWKK